jgi:hypothetical protein
MLRPPCGADVVALQWAAILYSRYFTLLCGADFRKPSILLEAPPQQPVQMSGMTVSTVLPRALPRASLGQSNRSGVVTVALGESFGRPADRASPSCFACATVAMAKSRIATSCRMFTAPFVSFLSAGSRQGRLPFRAIAMFEPTPRRLSKLLCGSPRPVGALGSGFPGTYQSATT